MYQKAVLILIILISVFAFSFLAFADENDVLASELNVEEPGLVSWFKDKVDTVRIWTTKDNLKKAELELKKASRQLIKIKKMAQKNPEDEGLQGKLEMINNRYEELIGKINDRVENYKEDYPDSERLSNFLNKYTEHQLKHQEILQKLETEVPVKVMERIQENRQDHLEKFSEVITRVHDNNEFKNHLKHVLENTENTVRQVNLMGVIEELGQQDVLEIRQRVHEMKQEHHQLIQNIKDASQQMIKDRTRAHNVIDAIQDTVDETISSTSTATTATQLIDDLGNTVEELLEGITN